MTIPRIVRYSETVMRKTNDLGVNVAAGCLAVILVIVIWALALALTYAISLGIVWCAFWLLPMAGVTIPADANMYAWAGCLSLLAIVIRWVMPKTNVVKS